MSQYIFLIPLFPLLGFLFNFIVGVRVLTPRPKRKTAPAGGHGHDDAHSHTPAPGHAPEDAVDVAPKPHSTAHADDDHGGHGHAVAHHAPSPVVGIVACLMVALSFAFAVLVVAQAHGAPEHTLTQKLWDWIPGGVAETAVPGGTGTSPFNIDWKYQVDSLSSVWVLFVTFIGFLIHVYSTGYMSHDPGYARFMSYLNLFMFSMLTLILGANYLMLFVGWEGVGLCSYLLIGFWFDKQSASDAGKKAFIVNRIGDAGFAIGMFYIFRQFGSLDFHEIAEQAAHLPVEYAWGGVLTIIGLCLFWGACGKSAQLPLYVWLPDAMEGPTPVSALIHAATMVTAGVYMVARSGAIYAHAPNAMMVVAVVGAATAIFAASIGLVQYDIKRVLAYSTVSQLGYMFLACGVGAFTAGAFHVFTHAFFKALLFLGSGSVIHGMSGEQDMRKMGGLKSKMPITHLTMLIGCIAIAGIPPLAGFFSKDEILWSAFKIGGYGEKVWMVAFIAAGMTAFYMFRLYFMTFHGAFRGTPEQAEHVHESPKSMTVPLMVLAVGSVFAGLLGIPATLDFLHVGNVFEHFMEPAFEAAHHALATVFPAQEHPHSLEYTLMGASIAIAAFGIALATFLYKIKPALSAALAQGLAPIHRVLLNKYYVDELYNAIFVRVVALGGGNTLWGVDRHLIDGGDGQVRPAWPLSVNGIGWLIRDLVAKASDFWDRWVVDGIVNLMAFTFDAASYVFRAVQNGRIQQYALVMLIGVFLLISAGHFLFALY
jgi:NADH-quinone oxidoreductase subunit L